MQRINTTYADEPDLVFDNSPRLLHRFLFIFILYITSSVSGLVSLCVGNSLMFEKARIELIYWLGIEVPFSIGEEIIRGFGMLFTGIGLLLLFMGVLCRMIDKRNSFILELFAWHKELKREEHKLIPDS